jgi:uncharacterized protein YndB with AHSA1/START domain
VPSPTPRPDGGSATAITVVADYDVTPDALWSTLAQVERHVDWMADAESIEFLTDARGGVGTRFVCVTKVGPIRLRDVIEITAWEPGRAMGVRHDGLVTGEGRFTLLPLDEGRRTRFTWTEQLRFPWWLGGPVTSRIGGRQVMARIWRGNLSRLRRLVEPSP